MLKIALPVRPLYALAKYAAGDEETRYYLKSVHVESGVMVATDGIRLLAAGHSWKLDNPVTLERTPLLKLRPRKLNMRNENDTAVIALDVDAHRYTIETVAGEPIEPLSGEIIQYDYPDWRRIIPSPDFTPKPAAFNGRYAGDMQSAADIVCGGKATIIPNGGAPAYVRFNEERLFGVIAPYRADLTPQRPTWLDWRPSDSAEAA